MLIENPAKNVHFGQEAMFPFKAIFQPPLQLGNLVASCSIAPASIPLVGANPSLSTHTPSPWGCYGFTHPWVSHWQQALNRGFLDLKAYIE